MSRLLRWRHRAAQPQQPMAPPAWSCLVSPAFRLITFAAIACYAAVLVAKSHSLPAAIAAAVIAAIGAWVSNLSDPFSRLAPARA
jgi:hypothetical protein